MRLADGVDKGIAEALGLVGPHVIVVVIIVELQDIFDDVDLGRGGVVAAEGGPIVRDEAGAEDVEYDGDLATIYAAPTEFLAVKAALEEAGLTFLSAETGYVPQNEVEVASKDDAKKILALIDALEDNDDVQSVYSNHSISDEWMDELAG